MKRTLFYMLVLLLITMQACSAGNAGPGPETLDLTDSALTAIEKHPDYKAITEIKLEGTDTAGEPVHSTMEMSVENQASPSAQRVAMVGKGISEGSLEMTIIDDQMLSVMPGMGCSAFPADSMGGVSPQDDFFTPKGLFIGETKRVETGVTIEGILTDQYELKPENIAEEDGESFPENFAGNIYVAQDGSYIVRVEMSGTSSGDAAFDMDPNTESTFSLTYTFTPVEAGSLLIEAPTECADQLDG